MQRRGFLQLLGLGATAGAANILPVFSTVSQASPWVADHYVMTGVPTTLGSFIPVLLGEREGVRVEHPRGKRTYLVGARSTTVQEALPAEDFYFAFHQRAQELRQEIHRLAANAFRGFRANSELIPDTDPVLAELATDPALAELAKYVRITGPTILVTVMETPLDRSDEGYGIQMCYSQYLVFGTVSGARISETGEYPISDRMDLDRLLNLSSP